MAWSCHSQVKNCGGQALFAHGWFLEPTPSAPQRWEHCWWWLTQISDSVSLFFGLALLLVSQPAAVYHLTHSITSAVGSLLPEVSHLIPCFHSSRREWPSPRMGRLALSPEEHAPALSALQRQQKLCPNFFSYTFYTQELCRHVRSSHII